MTYLTDNSYVVIIIDTLSDFITKNLISFNCFLYIYVQLNVPDKGLEMQCTLFATALNIYRPTETNTTSESNQMHQTILCQGPCFVFSSVQFMTCHLIYKSLDITRNTGCSKTIAIVFLFIFWSLLGTFICISTF